jgi:hypothetical protein
VNAARDRCRQGCKDTDIETYVQQNTDITIYVQQNTKRRRKNQEQQATSAASLPKVQHEKRSWSTYFLCIGFPSAETIADDDLLGIPIDLTDHEILNSPLQEIIERPHVSELGKTFGPAFVGEKDGEPVLHQSVMTTLLAAAVDQVQAEFQSWAWLKDQLRSNKLVEHIRAKQTSRVLLWVANNNSLWKGMSMTDCYNQLRTLAAQCGNLELCLSETEASWEELKIGDVKAFDQIAQDADPEFSWRPKTCFGTGICDLPSSPQGFMVTKRSHSCGAAHVLHVQRSDRRRLDCVESGDCKPSRVVKSSKPIWFHQEEVPALMEFGEFRIFFVKDQIVGAIRTKFEDVIEKRVIAAIPVSLADFYWYSNEPEKQEYKWSRLYYHATLIREKLLERRDAPEHYRSLRVAVRIDIGVSELTPEGKFFAGEVARFAGATWFSKILFRSPYTDMMERIAQAMVEEYG